ncbi:MAG: DUF3575 domain-containing protein [Bacteroidaceae bacterium]|nr:DUF3575 domain-containing protein [Bacteroidaceae bacterium]
MKTHRLTLILFLFVAYVAHAQVAVKTNVPMDILRLPNLGVEVALGKKYSIDLTGYYNPWKFSDSKQHKLLLVQPELRYWFCDVFNGHFIGAHLMAGAYNTMGFKPPFGLWDDMDTYRYKGRFYGGGLVYGYSWILDRHWNLEATIGIGYNYVTYEKYECKECAQKMGDSDKNYIGPTKAAVNLIYVF